MKRKWIVVESTLKEQLEKTEAHYQTFRNLPVRSRIAEVLSKRAPRTLGRTGTHVLVTLKKAGLLPALDETAKRIRNIMDWMGDQENPQ